MSSLERTKKVAFSEHRTVKVYLTENKMTRRVTMRRGIQARIQWSEWGPQALQLWADDDAGKLQYKNDDDELVCPEQGAYETADNDDDDDDAHVGTHDCCHESDITQKDFFLPALFLIDFDRRVDESANKNEEIEIFDGLGMKIQGQRWDELGDLDDDSADLTDLPPLPALQHRNSR